MRIIQNVSPFTSRGVSSGQVKGNLIKEIMTDCIVGAAKFIQSSLSPHFKLDMRALLMTSEIKLFSSKCVETLCLTD